MFGPQRAGEHFGPHRAGNTYNIMAHFTNIHIILYVDYTLTRHKIEHMCHSLQFSCHEFRSIEVGLNQEHSVRVMSLEDRFVIV